jgi:cysteine-rich repeat protein
MRARRAVPRAALVLLLSVAAPAMAGFTERVSVGLGGVQANAPSGVPFFVSPDGRLVAFTSAATNLGGSPGGAFLRDRIAGTTTRIAPYAPGAITPDMQVLAFTAFSAAVPGDTNGVSDVYVYERASATVERVSVATGGGQGSGASDQPAISADGRFVAFRSYAPNLVPGDTNITPDIFVRDRVGGTTERVSVAFDGSQASSGAGSEAPVISPDGRYVAFESRSTNLVPGGTNGNWHVFLRDRTAATTELVDILPDNSQPGSETCCDGIALTPDGRYVAFVSSVPFVPPPGVVYEVFVRDRVLGTTEHISVTTDASQPTGGSTSPDISDDGRLVSFASYASNLVAGDTNAFGSDVFVRDRTLATTERVDVATDGTQTSEHTNSVVPRISGDGRVVIFLSDADNLVADDTNGAQDIFARDRTCGNGMPDTGEACDDGNNVDSDGCDANCTVTGCGNARVTAGEACDDGAGNGADACCSAGCTLVDADGDGVCDANDVCTGPAVAGGKVAVSGLVRNEPDDRLKFGGRLAVPVPFSPPLDPPTNGVRALVTDAAGRTVVDLLIPGGAGWETSTGGNAWRYANGATMVNLVTQGGTVRFGVRARGALFPPNVGTPPLVGTIFLHPPDDSAGQCGQSRGTCVTRRAGDRVLCH